MNLIEAFKTGREIKRPRHGDWLSSVFLQRMLLGTASSKLPHILNAEDLLADDWMVSTQKTALERVIDRINYLRNETGRHPNLLDVPATEFDEVRTELLADKTYQISDRSRGIRGLYVDTLEVCMGSGPTILVRGER
jgi:hypothetical protein